MRCFMFARFVHEVRRWKQPKSVILCDDIFFTVLLILRKIIYNKIYNSESGFADLYEYMYILLSHNIIIIPPPLRSSLFPFQDLSA